jgi:hypothetical protein
VSLDWEKEAESWVTSARTPGHDAYWLYRDEFFALVPPPGRETPWRSVAVKVEWRAIWPRADTG